MRIPAIKGTMDRRILVNYRVEPTTLARALPPPFAPKLINGYGIAGICLIRLTGMRPWFAPAWCGTRSENAAHRIAVTWMDNGERREGVYIPRRDTDSRFNALVGGRLFPGVHHRASFEVNETDDRLAVSLNSSDGDVRVQVVGTVARELPADSVFGTCAQASAFFEHGSLGYSATATPGRFDGLELACHTWRVDPLHVEHVHSSYLQDEQRFPKGTATFDCALLMRNIALEWRGRPDLCCAAAG